MARIVSDTPDEIVIEDRPVALAAILSALLLIALFFALEGFRSGDRAMLLTGAIFAAGTGIALRRAIRHVRLVLRCDGAATLIVRGPGGVTRRTFPPGTLRAGLATDRSEGKTHRVILLAETDAGLERLPLTSYLGSGTRHADVVRRINAWAAR
jgi:hypothetical protein